MLAIYKRLLKSCGYTDRILGFYATFGIINKGLQA